MNSNKNASISRVEELLREGPLDITPEQPSPLLWDRIAAEVSETEDAAQQAPVKVKASSRSWSRTALSLAAGLVLVAGIGLTLLNRDTGTQLAALGNFGGDATAWLEDDSVRVEVDGLIEEDDAYYELWLIDTDESGEIVDLVSLGPINESGDFDIASDIDPASYSVVDISIEANDGDETHSGNSVLRGDLA